MVNPGDKVNVVMADIKIISITVDATEQARYIIKDIFL